jgi:hypothetical protein
MNEHVGRRQDQIDGPAGIVDMELIACCIAVVVKRELLLE